MDHPREDQNGQILDEGDVEGIEDLGEVEVVEELVCSDSEEIYATDDSVLTFDKHSEPVFCCNIDNKHHLVVSGGQDDKAYVWDMATGKVVFECSGHADSVTCVEFNHDSSLVATGDMSGIIQVWDVQKKNKIWDFSTSDLKWLQWLPGKDFLMAGTDCGDAWLWHVPEGDITTFPSFGMPSTVGKVINEEKVVIGYDDGAVRIWDLNNVVVLGEIVGRRAHNGTITTVDCDENGLIISGSIDGTSKLILGANGKVINTFQCANTAADSKSPDSVESVAFLKNQHSFVTGTVNGSLAVWDIGSHVQKLKFKQEGGVVKILCHRNAPLLFTAGVDGIVRLFDSRTGNMEASWEGHECEILDFDLTRDGQTIVTASEDGTCKVFNVEQR